MATAETTWTLLVTARTRVFRWVFGLWIVYVTYWAPPRTDDPGFDPGGVTWIEPPGSSSLADSRLRINAADRPQCKSHVHDLGRWQNSSGSTRLRKTREPQMWRDGQRPRLSSAIHGFAPEHRLQFPAVRASLCRLPPVGNPRGTASCGLRAPGVWVQCQTDELDQRSATAGMGGVVEDSGSTITMSMESIANRP